jgi:hypothetical protein
MPRSITIDPNSPLDNGGFKGSTQFLSEPTKVGLLTEEELDAEETKAEDGTGDSAPQGEGVFVP